MGKEGEKAWIFSLQCVYIPRNLKELRSYFFRLYQGIYLRKGKANISRYVPMKYFTLIEG